jgi:uncharacterized membrane protein YphA (DoxX/SURF4 family)
MTTPLAASPLDKRMQILAYVLGAAHVVFGATKLTAVAPVVAQFHAWGLPPWMMVFVGVAQVLGGAGFFIRNLRMPASFAMGLVMVGATVTLLATGHERGMAPLTVVLGGLCFVVAGHRLFQFAREFVADENAKRARGATLTSEAA